MMNSYLTPGDILVYWKSNLDQKRFLLRYGEAILSFFNLTKPAVWKEDFEDCLTSCIYGGLDDKGQAFAYHYKGHELRTYKIQKGDHFSVFSPSNPYHQKVILRLCKNWDTEEIIYFKEFLRVDSFYPKRERNFAFMVYTACNLFQLNALTCHNLDIERWLHDGRDFKKYNIYYADKSSTINPDFIYNHLYHWYYQDYISHNTSTCKQLNGVDELLFDIDELIDDFELKADDQIKIIKEVVKTFYKDKIYDAVTQNITQNKLVRLFEQLNLLLGWLETEEGRHQFYLRLNIAMIKLIIDSLQKMIQTAKTDDIAKESIGARAESGEEMVSNKILLANNLSTEQIVLIKAVENVIQLRLTEFDNQGELTLNSYRQLIETLINDTKDLCTSHQAQIKNELWLETLNSALVSIFSYCQEQPEVPQGNPVWRHML